MPEPKLIEVYATATGRKQFVPEHFLGHPVLGRGIALTPSRRDQLPPAGDPEQSWSRKQLDAYATGLGLDTTALASKGAVLDAIADHQQDQSPVVDSPVDGTQTTDGTPLSDETPA